jgi:hypothetical protein
MPCCRRSRRLPSNPSSSRCSPTPRSSRVRRPPAGGRMSTRCAPTARPTKRSAPRCRWRPTSTTSTGLPMRWAWTSSRRCRGAHDRSGSPSERDRPLGAGDHLDGCGDVAVSNLGPRDQHDQAMLLCHVRKQCSARGREGRMAFAADVPCRLRASDVAWASRSMMIRITIAGRRGDVTATKRHRVLPLRSAVIARGAARVSQHDVPGQAQAVGRDPDGIAEEQTATRGDCRDIAPAHEHGRAAEAGIEAGQRRPLRFRGSKVRAGTASRPPHTVTMEPSTSKVAGPPGASRSQGGKECVRTTAAVAGSRKVSSVPAVSRVTRLSGVAASARAPAGAAKSPCTGPAGPRRSKRRSRASTAMPAPYCTRPIGRSASGSSKPARGCAGGVVSGVVVPPLWPRPTRGPATT